MNLLLTFIAFVPLTLAANCGDSNEVEEAYLCANQDIDFGADPFDHEIICLGFASCLNTNLLDFDDYGDFKCSASAACVGMTSNYGNPGDILSDEVDEIEAEGFLSAAKINVLLDQVGYSEIVAFGALSLYNAEFVADTSLADGDNSGITFECRATGGLAYVNASNIESDEIYGLSPYCFYNSIFIMQDDSNVDLYGRLSGYNGRFICPEGYECVIDCNDYYSSCYNAIFDCDPDESACYVEGCDHSDGSEKIWCPLMGDKYNNINWYDYYEGIHPNESNMTWYSLDADEYLLNWIEEFVDQYGENSESIISFFNDTCVSNECDAAYSCQGSDVDFSIPAYNDTAATAFCINGFAAAGNNTDSMSQDELMEYDVICGGYESCDGVIISGTNIWAMAEYAIETWNGSHTSIISYNGGDVHCEASDSCYDLVSIVSESMGGYYETSLYCNGFGSCFSADEILGFTNIYGFGEQSLNNSYIESNGNGSYLNVYLDTDYPFLDIYCNDYDTCTVYCFGNNTYCAYHVTFHNCELVEGIVRGPSVSTNTTATMNNYTATCQVLLYYYDSSTTSTDEDDDTVSTTMTPSTSMMMSTTQVGGEGGETTQATTTAASVAGNTTSGGEGGETPQETTLTTTVGSGGEGGTGGEGETPQETMYSTSTVVDVNATQTPTSQPTEMPTKEPTTPPVEVENTSGAIANVMSLNILFGLLLVYVIC